MNVLDGRLPGLPVAMRLGWSQRAEFHRELDFARPSPPIGGSIAGMSDRLAAPPFPPGLASDPTLFLGIWLEGDPEVVSKLSGGAQFGNKLPLTIADGKVGGTAGVYRVTTARLRPILKVQFFPSRSPARALSWNLTFSPIPAIPMPITRHRTRHRPPSGGGPAVLYEAASVAIGASTGLIAGDVVCPATGDLEFYFEGLTGTQAVAASLSPEFRRKGYGARRPAQDTAYSNDTSRTCC